jgi:hypothetical protein
MNLFKIMNLVILREIHKNKSSSTWMVHEVVLSDCNDSSRELHFNIAECLSCNNNHLTVQLSDETGSQQARARHVSLATW